MGCPGIETYVWRPRDMDTVCSILAKGELLRAVTGGE